jgi:hypothetical protein
VSAGILAPAKASQVVEIQSEGTNNCPCTSGGCGNILLDILLNPAADPPIQQAGFVVPAGQVLVVTDMSFQVQAPVGHNVLLGLNRVSGSFGNAIVQTSMTGAGTATVQAVSLRGAVVKPGVSLCALVLDENAPAIPSSLVTVHGFLAPDK